MASIEGIRAAQTLIKETHDTWGHGDDDLNNAVVTVDLALDELAALRAWQARAVPLLAALANIYADEIPDESDCFGCGAFLWCNDGIDHAPDCPTVLARALLAESEARDGDDDDLSPLPCGCHRLPPLACAAVKAHANPFAPWQGPVCDCPCHSGGVVVESEKGARGMSDTNKRDPMKLIYRADGGNDANDRRARQMDAWFFGGVAVIAVLFILAVIIGR